MLSGHRAAHLDADLEDPPPELLGALDLPRPVRVEEDEGVQVAVPGVEHVGHVEPVLGRELAHALEDLGEALAGDGAVDAVVVGRDAADGGKRGLAAEPEPGPRGLVVGDPELARPRAFEDRADLLDLGRGLGFRAVHLAQQDGRRIGRVAAVGEVLRGPDRGIVHHLEASRDDPARHDVRHRVPGASKVVEGGEEDPGGLGLGQEPHGHLDDDPEHPFRTGDEGEEVVAGGVERLATQGEKLAFDVDHLDLEDVVDGEPVLEAVQPARVLGDVPADGARDLRGRVRRVVKTVRIGRLGDGEIAHAGLHPGKSAVGIELEDAAELGEAEEKPVLEGEGASGEAGAGTAGNHRHVLRGGHPHDPLHVLDPIGEDGDHRKPAVDGEPVALEGPELLRLGEHRFAGEEGEEIGSELFTATGARPVVAGKGSGSGHWKCPAAPCRPLCRAVRAAFVPGSVKA